VDAQRAHQIRAVHRDRVDAQVEHHGDFLIRLAVSDELQDLLLALRQLVVRIVGPFERAGLDRADQHAGQLGAEVLLSGGDRPHRAREVRLDRALEDVPLDAGVQRVLHVLFVGVHAQDQDARAGPLLQQLDRRMQPVHLRHGHVHHDNVRVQLLGKGNGVHAIAGLADDNDLPIVFEDPPESLPHERVIVNENHADRRRVLSQWMPPLDRRPSRRRPVPPSSRLRPWRIAAARGRSRPALHAARP
jgi:hypothetical protein